jgi:mRNA interferase MazF
VRLARGDVVWVEPGEVLGAEQAGRRPYLVISHEVYNVRFKTVIAVALTSKDQSLGFPLSHSLRSGNLPRPSWVKIGQVRSISVLRLGRRIGHVDEAEVDRVVEGLMEIVGG